MQNYILFITKCSTVVFLVASLNVLAQTKDHALVSGPAGYKIDGDIQVKEFATLSEGVLNGFTCENDTPCSDKVPGFKNGKLAVEGKSTQIRYTNSKNPAGDLAILRNYENVFKQLGGRKLTSRASAYGTHLFFVEKDNKRTWMALDNGNDFVYLTFLEEKGVEQIVTAGQLASSISKQGFATLYINFDNNKSDIKPEAQPGLKEVVQLLKTDTALKLSVEGHTDNVGNASSNKTLSGTRADSVVKFLIAGGIEAKRLSSKGLGSDAPVADNRGEEGRTKNRRVELVKMK